MKKMELKPKKGMVLVSKPFLHDPYFKRSVVLLTEHNKQGTVGFILNKPINIKINEALEEFPAFDSRLYMGGPVQKESLYYLHTLGDTLNNSMKICEGIYWGGNFEALKIMVESKAIESSNLRFYMGYSGWDGKQLTRELNNDSWIVAPGKSDYVINEDPLKLWNNILKGMGKEYAMLANFPEHPSLN